MSHPTYNKRPGKYDTVLTEATNQLCRKYDLTTPAEQSILLTLTHQLVHNNTIGWSQDDIINRLDTLLKAARRSACVHDDYCTH